MKGVPRSHVYRLIRSGQVRVNSGRAAPSYRIKTGDRIRIPPVSIRQPSTRAHDPWTLAWLEERIVYEDRRLMLIDKPAGMAVHGGSGVSLGCVEALRVLRPSRPEIELVHRLDRATSGCLLLAKRRSMLRSLHESFRRQKIRKKYFALVRGSWPRSIESVGAPLTVSRHDRKRVVGVDPRGKPSSTRFSVIERFGNFATLLDVQIETGRMHQIRVHAAHVGHPVAGDDRYGDVEFDQALASYGLRRMFLHAYSISFELPEKKVIFGLCVPLPLELKEPLRLMRAAIGCAPSVDPGRNR